MAESIAEQILAKIKTELEAITGDNGAAYWYTPGKVVRVDYFNSKTVFKDGYGNPIYLIRDTGDEDENSEYATMGGMASDLGVFVMVAYQDDRGERDPFTATTLSGTIRNRMLRDVQKKMETDHTRGSLAINTAQFSKRRDFVEPAGWILGELHFVVSYEYTRGTP